MDREQAPRVLFLAEELSQFIITGEEDSGSFLNVAQGRLLEPCIDEYLDGTDVTLQVKKILAMTEKRKKEEKENGKEEQERGEGKKEEEEEETWSQEMNEQYPRRIREAVKCWQI